MPDKPPPPSPTSAAARLRHAIDSGNTGDKVNYPDPAAAPLGTDDEAAGTTPALMEKEIDAELVRMPQNQRSWVKKASGKGRQRSLFWRFCWHWLLSRAGS